MVWVLVERLVGDYHWFKAGVDSVWTFRTLKHASCRSFAFAWRISGHECMVSIAWILFFDICSFVL